MALAESPKNGPVKRFRDTDMPPTQCYSDWAGPKNTTQETGVDMPKIKTLRGAAKRFRKTANGFKHAQSYKRHILTKKASKRKRQLGPKHQVEACDVASVKQMLPHV